MVYEPREDSYLLEAVVRRVVEPGMTVLDVGAGSGIQSFSAAERGAKVTAVDVDPAAVAHVERVARAQELSVEAVESDLFENVDGTYDLIVFNAPYLPSDPRDPDPALDGGAEGHETIVRFLKEAKEHLRSGGSILLLFSTQTGYERVLEAIADNGYTAEELAMHPLFFERLFVYRLRL